MKQVFTPLLIILTALCLHSNAQVAYWPFNGNPDDTSGNGNHGTLHNVTLTTGRDGIPNTAYFFSGNNSYISVPYNAGWDVNEYTIAAVVRPAAFNQDSCQGNSIINRGQMSAGRWALMFTDNMYNDCNTADTAKYLFQTYPGYASFASNTPFQYTPAITTNTWYTVIATYDGNQVRIYVDGVLKSAASYIANMAPTLDSVIIGRELADSGNASPFIGAIDEIRFYNRVLSAVEIQNYTPAVPANIAQASIKSSGIALSPNPCNAFVDVKLTAMPASRVDAQLFNPLGQSVYQGSFTAQELRISMAAFPAGIYTLHLSSGPDRWVSRVVKQ
jgi:hypothetical protein